MKSVQTKSLHPSLLKPQDVAILLKLLVWEEKSQHCPSPPNLTLAWIADETYLSISEIHYALGRADASQLLHSGERRVKRHALEELILHGLRYVFPPARGTMIRGVPTSYAASPLKERFINSDKEVPVWPYSEGDVRGIAFSPLYPLAPAAAVKDREFYELLALTDALRGESRARERMIASEILRKKIAGEGRPL